MSNSEEELERKVKELQDKMKKDINDVCERFGTQMKKAFFDKLHEDFKQVPPKTDHIKKCVNELVDGLCKFVPTRTQLHEKIREEIIYDEINIETMPYIVGGLIKWIQQFQSPYHDRITKQWVEDYKNCKDYADFLRDFFKQYYEHIEVVYKEVWEARQRLVNGENVIPPQHRPVVKGKNGVPDVMRSGLK